jgi:hypothetical protein
MKVSPYHKAEHKQQGTANRRQCDECVKKA